MADRIIVMNKAVVMQEGTPEEIYEHPEDVYKRQGEQAAFRSPCPLSEKRMY